MGVLVPRSEIAVGGQVGPGVHGKQRRVRNALSQSGHDQGGRGFGQ
ncbi:hypothetical protein [Pseudomonas sp. S2_F03]